MNVHRHTMRLLFIVTGRACSSRKQTPTTAQTKNNRPHRTPPLSVILSARSTRSFLQSSEASSKKSSRLRRRDLRTITNSFPRAKELFCVHKCQKRTRVCANKVLREIRPRLRRDRPTGFVRSFHSRTQDDRGGKVIKKFVRTYCAARSEHVTAMLALRASQGHFVPMFRMTAGEN